MLLLQLNLKLSRVGLSVFSGLYECARRHSPVTIEEE
jgi:hypothetical protein